MKIVVFGPERRVGVLRGNQVIDLSLAYAKYLKERQSERQPTRLAAVMVPSDLARFIEGGQRTLELADTALDHLFGNVQDQLGPNGEVLLRKASEVRLHAPRPDGSRIACAGGNFADHLTGMAAMGLLPGAGRMSIDEAAKKIRDNGIWGFWKVGRHTAASGEQLPYPSRADRLDYEGEVAIILNREVRDVRATDAKDLVWGVTLLGDWSIRSPAEPTGPLRFGMAKNFDQSCSLGPCIIVGELDPTDIDVETYVNGERRQQFNTRDMVFSFWEYIEYLSRDLTLYPGDIISGGTAAGTASDSSPRLADGNFAPERFLKPGDVVRITSPATGALEARIGLKP
jgi:2-keto-4-pentenoate hydratase/2-oxohepta-3-ene-1,7-dioic acid hydratase in catechol pathway